MIAPSDITLQDQVKRLYQRHFGGGHMIADPAAALTRLQAECAALPPVPFAESLFEPIGGGICRMHLRPALRSGLSLETIGAMFVYSANHTRGDDSAFHAALDSLCPQGDGERRWLAEYRANGCPALSHSDAYRKAFAPAYRVVSDIFCHHFDLFARIDRLRHGIIAIDGPCTSGKSTLAALLAEVFGANLLHMDDFFLRPEQRTPERLAQPGGNVDRERFLQAVLRPLANGAPFSYRPYDCQAQALAAPVFVEPRAFSVVEGVYSLHPDLAVHYALRLFLTIDAETQRERLLHRNGEAMAQRFQNEWVPLENAYFEALNPQARADMALRPAALIAQSTA